MPDSDPQFANPLSFPPFFLAPFSASGEARLEKVTGQTTELSAAQQISRTQLHFFSLFMGALC